MKIAIACDHGGYDLKEYLKDYLIEKSYQVVDYGTENGHISVDYPKFAEALTIGILNGEAGKGILICGTGIGMSIAANRHKGIRATLCEDVRRAELARQHNDSNVLVLAGRFTPAGEAKKIVDTWLVTEFEGGRHTQRLAKIDELGGDSA